MNGNNKRARITFSGDPTYSEDAADVLPRLGPIFGAGFQALSDKYDAIKKKNKELAELLEPAKGVITQQNNEIEALQFRYAALNQVKLEVDKEEKVEIDQLRRDLTAKDKIMGGLAETLTEMEKGSRKMIAEYNDAVAVLKQSLEVEKAKTVEANNRNLALKTDLNDNKAATAQQEAANAKHEQVKALKDKVIAGLEAKIELTHHKAPGDETPANYEHVSTLYEKIIAGLEAKVALAELTAKK